MLSWYRNYHGVHVYIVDSLSYLCSLGTGIIMTRVLFEIPSLTYALLVGNYHGARIIQDSLSYLCSFGTGIIIAHVYIVDSPYLCSLGTGIIMARVLFKIFSLTYALLVQELSLRAFIL